MAQIILVIEKGGTVTATLQRGLDPKNYTISAASQRTALSRSKKRKPDLIIIDTLSIPYDKVGDLCKSLHKTTHTSTIALVYKRWPAEVLEGTTYLMASAELPRLCARLRAVLELQLCLKEQQNKRDAPIISLGGLQLDMEKRCLSRKGNQSHLTPKAARLLFAFMAHPGLVLTRRWLMKEVWETDYIADTRTLYVHVRWLRQTIEEDPGTPRFLKTIRGIGYLFEVPSQITRALN